MSFLSTMLDIVENALRDPTDKAAVQIAIDGVAAWKEIATNPKIIKLEADIGAYVATLPKPLGAPVIAPPDTPSSGQRPESPGDFNRWQAEHPLT